VNDKSPSVIAWNGLSAEEQTRLRIEYGYYLDKLPPTCSLEQKEARFAQWLAERNITYKSN
jgi:hypothetical protein